MLIVCIRAFGNFVPGDEVEISKGATYDTFYFELVTADKESK